MALSVQTLQEQQSRLFSSLLGTGRSVGEANIKLLMLPEQNMEEKWGYRQKKALRDLEPLAIILHGKSYLMGMPNMEIIFHHHFSIPV